MRRGPWFPALLIAALLVAYATFGWRGLQRLADSDRWVVHTYEVKFCLGLKLLWLKEAESAQRGYLLTGRPAYFEPYAKARERAFKLHAQLLTLTADNPAQQKRLAKFHGILRGRFAELERVLAIYKESGQAAAIEALEDDRGLQLTEQLVESGARMFEAEDQLLARRLAAKQAAYRSLIWTTGLLLVGVAVLGTGLVVSTWFTLAYHRTMLARRADADA